MKLRNKQTGGLANLIVDKDLLRVKTDAGWADYGSLAELNEEWEDYEPSEPLINLKIDNSQKLLIEEAVAMFASQDKLRGGYHIKQAQKILHILNNSELCGESES